MKILFVLFVSVFALLLGSCAEQYKANRGPAPYSPDFSGVLPQPSNRPPGY
jgi:hypothetical protein